jgi:putative multiple sugar transport system substrate-binding protein
MIKKLIAIGFIVLYAILIISACSSVPESNSIPLTIVNSSEPSVYPVIASTATLTPTLLPTLTEVPKTPTASPTIPPTPTYTLEVGPGGKIPVGIILPSTSMSFYRNSRLGFMNYLSEHKYSAQVLLSNNSAIVEKSNIKTLLKQNIKVLILCSVEPWNAKEIVDEVHSAGIKVIAYDRMIQNTTSLDYYVYFDTISIGEMQAKYLVDHVKRKGMPLFLYAGSYNDNNSLQFFEGAWNVLQPKINDGTFIVKNSTLADKLKNKPILSENEKKSILSGIAVENWSQDEARKLARENLKAITAEDKGDVAILSPNDGIARALADVFANDKEIKSFLITGQDADPLSVQYIRSGKQSMTVYKDGKLLAKYALDAALTFLTNQIPPSIKKISNGASNIPTGPSALIVVDRFNVDTFQK